MLSYLCRRQALILVRSIDRMGDSLSWKEPKLQGFDTQPLLAMVKVDETPSYVMVASKDPAQQSVPWAECTSEHECMA